VIVRTLLAALLLVRTLPAAEYKLPVSPETIAWGYYWAGAKPALTIRSGDTVEIPTLLDTDPVRMEQLGVRPDQIQPELRQLYAKVPKENRGPGGQILHGPISIEGAQPGDVLEVRILSIRMDLPYAYNGHGKILMDEFERGAKIIQLDRSRGVARFAPGIEIPLHPFFGGIGVAPPASAGKINSGPPGIHAGNLDNKELVAGTTLYIPVHVPGALFEVGDGHAGQGNGEVDRNALETSLTGVFQFVVRHDMHLTWPRAETPTHYITMGLSPDLLEATKGAVRETIDFLVNEKKLTREDAYTLASVAIDFDITQAVDGTLGVHGMIPKSLFTGGITGLK
jgi:acetamidase/formamidase